MYDFSKRFFTKLAAALVAAFMLFTVTSCHFWEETIAPQPEEVDYNTLITGLSFSVNSVNVNKGEKAQLVLNVTPKEYQNRISVQWDFEEDKIDLAGDSYQALITGKEAGGTYVKAKCNGIIATCLVSVISNGDDVTEDPYIYSNDAVVELLPDKTYTLTASLYGGSVEDMEDFVWNSANPSIAEIVPGRNNCIVHTKAPGSTTVTATHPKAKYEYTFIIFCYTDKMTVPYITTTNNVVSIDKNTEKSRTAKVDLRNPYSSGYINDFKFELADESSKSIIEISSSQNCCDIKPLKSGIARIRVSHPQCPDYPLDIIVRVTAIVQNTYISLSQSTLLITGSDDWHSVTANIENYDGIADPECFTFEVQDEQNAKAVMDWNVHGNVISIKGKKNGKVNIKVGHELSELKRTLLVILQEQIGSAVDSSMYITTSQNYVQTKVGDEPTVISVMLIGGVDGEDNVGNSSFDKKDATNFSWYVSSNANDMVDFMESTGSVFSRSAVNSGKSCEAILKINPKKEGSFSVFVGHPRCLYETEIKVKVLSEYALTEPPVTIESDSIIRLANQEAENSTHVLTPSLKKGGQAYSNAALANLIKYKSDKISEVTAEPLQGPSTTLKAVATDGGQHSTYVTLSLEGALAEKKVLVLQAATLAEAEQMKAMWADESYCRLMAGTTKNITLNTAGFVNGDSVSWTSSDSDIVSVTSGGMYNQTVTIDAKKKGTAVVTASMSGCLPVTINVTVTPVGEEPDAVHKNAYITTSMNAVVLEEPEERADLSVTGVNIEKSYGYNWELKNLTASDSEILFELNAAGNGENATITSKKPGKALINVSHEESQNEVQINVKCGNILEWSDGYIPYIVCENGEDVLNIVKGDIKTFGCQVANTTEQGNFTFAVTHGSDNIEITPSISGSCTVVGKEAGQSIITVSNSVAGDVTKEILVNVANSPEELAAFKYLTTKDNVINVGQGQNRSVTVSVENSTNPVISGYSWSSLDESRATVSGAGNTAVISGKEIGTSRILVSNSECDWPLEIIVNVIDPIAAMEDPYISCPNIITVTAGGEASDVSAELVGGDASMSTGFTWSTEDSSIAMVYGSNSSAKIKGLKEGVTRIAVQHPNASVRRFIMVIVEPQKQSDCYITLSESIIKMSPSDDAKTIIATLNGGTDKDIYGFKWWADDYKIVTMNYAQNECTITPVSSGTVNLHVSHPKAKGVKDIILYISQYSDFAFAEQSIELFTGGDTRFVQMEVPASSTEYVLVADSTDHDVCTVPLYNTTVCSLQPGTKPGACKVWAELRTKGGAVQARAEMAVALSLKDETKPYIKTNGSTTVMMNVNETTRLTALLAGTSLADTTSSGLRWNIDSQYKNIIKFNTGNSTSASGKEVSIKALASGKAILKVTHEPDNNRVISPLLIYVHVSGTTEPTVTLDWKDTKLYVGEDAMPLTATVINDSDCVLDWTVTQNPEGCCEIVNNSPKLMIQPRKPGTVKVKVSIQGVTGPGGTAECNITVEEPPRLEYFVYTDENAMTGETLVDRINVYPGQTKRLHYRSVPKARTIRNGISGHYLSDENRVYCNDLGYAKKTPDGRNIYPDNVGTVEVLGKDRETETPVFYRLTTEDNISKDITITNLYNYNFTVNQTAISTSVADAVSKGTLGPIEYKLSPSSSYLQIDLYNNNVTIDDSLYPTVWYKNSAGQIVQAERITAKKYKISSHEKTDPVTQSSEGKIYLKTSNEFYGTMSITPTNVQGTNIHTFSNINVNLSWYYSSHKFKVTSSGEINDGVYGNFSYYDKAANRVVLGDGEEFSLTVQPEEPHSMMYYTGYTFDKKTSSSKKDGDSKTQSERMIRYDINSVVSGVNKTYTVTIKHSKDYGAAASGEKKYYIPNGDNRTDDMLEVMESGNQTVKEYSYVGDIVIKYKPLDYTTSGSDNGIGYRIPVFVEVRNCLNTDRKE